MLYMLFKKNFVSEIMRFRGKIMSLKRKTVVAVFRCKKKEKKNTALFLERFSWYFGPQYEPVNHIW